MARFFPTSTHLHLPRGWKLAKQRHEFSASWLGPCKCILVCALMQRTWKIMCSLLIHAYLLIFVSSKIFWVHTTTTTERVSEIKSRVYLCPPVCVCLHLYSCHVCVRAYHVQSAEMYFPRILDAQATVDAWSSLLTVEHVYHVHVCLQGRHASWQSRFYYEYRVNSFGACDTRTHFSLVTVEDRLACASTLAACTHRIVDLFLESLVYL